MISLLTLLSKLFFIATGIGGIAFLIFFHELGHFLFCKLFRVHTPTFSIGFGPVIWSRLVGTTKFTVCAIPLGGYVEIAGMDTSDQSQTALDTGESSFSQKPYYQKFCILMGGILFNIILAFKMTVLVYLFGAPGSMLLYPETATNTIARVIPESTAAQEGLQAGDTITAFNGIPLSTHAEPLLSYFKTTPASLTLTYTRDTQPYQTSALTLQAGKQLGIVFNTEKLRPAGLIEAISRAVRTTERWIRDTGRGLIHILKKADFSAAGGPVKIISMISQSAQDGFLVYLLFLAIISINLALFNLIPVPILDGGQLLLTTIESLIRRPLPTKVREYIFIGTWLLFIGLIIFLSFHDIASLIAPYFQSIKQCLPNSLLNDA